MPACAARPAGVAGQARRRSRRKFAPGCRRERERGYRPIHATTDCCYCLVATATVLELPPIGSSYPLTSCLCTGRNGSGQVALPFVVVSTRVGQWRACPRDHARAQVRPGRALLAHGMVVPGAAGFGRLVAFCGRACAAGNG
jgi:hypothetical protein